MSPQNRARYIQAVLKLYQRLPGTATRPRPADRRLAGELHQRGISIETVEIALRLAAARRMARPRDAAPLPPVRSLHYFLPVIDDLPAGPPPEGYLDYLRDLVPDRELAIKSNTTPPTRSSRRHPRQLRLPLQLGGRPENDVS